MFCEQGAFAVKLRQTNDLVMIFARSATSGTYLGGKACSELSK
jgi:hypothetical protein